MPTMTGKRALMEMLRAEGVEYIFGNPGTSEGPILDELENYPDIRYMLTTQEGAAMGMADAYARYRGEPAFINLHIETGLANGISLLANAAEGNTPLVLTSANKDIRKLAEGRTNLVEMVSQFCKWSAEVTHPEQVPSVMRRAFNEAKTPPMGPVYVAFSANALDDEAEVSIVPSHKIYSRTAPDANAIAEAANILADATNPVLIVGDGVGRSHASREAARLAETLGAKVYASFYSHVNFPTSHPQYLGMANPGMPDGKALLADSDAVVAVGTPAFPGVLLLLRQRAESGRQPDSHRRGRHADRQDGADRSWHCRRPAHGYDRARRCARTANERRGKRGGDRTRRIGRRREGGATSGLAGAARIAQGHQPDVRRAHDDRDCSRAARRRDYRR